MEMVSLTYSNRLSPLLFHVQQENMDFTCVWTLQLASLCLPQVHDMLLMQVPVTMFHRQPNLAKLLAQQEHTQHTITEALPVLKHQRVIMFHQQAKYLKLLALQEPTKQQQVRVPVTKQMLDIMSIHLWVRVKPLKLLA